MPLTMRGIGDCFPQVVGFTNPIHILDDETSAFEHAAELQSGFGARHRMDYPFHAGELAECHGWHATRRGLGSNLYALGVPEKVIQQILRHTNVSTTNTYYIKTVPAQVTDAMEKLQQALPDSLSGNEVATDTWKAAAYSTVN
jgi:hypothetical protein